MESAIHNPPSALVTVPQVHRALRRLKDNPEWLTVLRYLMGYADYGATAFVPGSPDRTVYWLGKQDVLNRLRWIEDLAPDDIERLEAQLAAGTANELPEDLRRLVGRAGVSDLFAKGIDRGENQQP